MISSLRGKVTKIWGNNVEIEVGGVGYEVYQCRGALQCARTDQLRVGEEIKIPVYLAVSENEWRLFGFRSEEEKDIFKLLITVSGVGPKTAAQILGLAKTEEVVKAIGEADVDFFKKIKGVGLKTAQRIIVDLKSKIGGLGELNLKDDLPLVEDDVVLSLKQLGFEKKEIEKVIKSIPKELVTIEERLEWCLGNME